MALKFGPSSIDSKDRQSKFDVKKEVKSVRVKDIVLSPDHPRFKEVGGWLGLGTIFFDSVDLPSIKNSGKTQQQAKPYFSNSKFFPLINEIVTIIQSQDPIQGQNPKLLGTRTNYYFPPVNIWNSPHHNALISPLGDDLNPINLDKKSYDQINNGIPNIEKNQPTAAFLGEQFKEKDNILPLFSYEGDFLLEGRWGNSIRLGSTVNNGWLKNKWSSVGENGDPILIIRNGQDPNNNQEGWTPIIEDVGYDLSSIYLTSTQQIQFFPSSFNTDSFGPGDTPIFPPSQYQGNQIILNSGKLTLNARSEGVLVSSPSIIHLSAGDSIHLDSADKAVISASEIYLISRNSKERVILGDTFIREFSFLLENLKGLAEACEVASVDGAPIIALQAVGGSLKTVLNEFLATLDGDNPKVLSKKVKIS